MFGLTIKLSNVFGLVCFGLVHREWTAQISHWHTEYFTFTKVYLRILSLDLHFLSTLPWVTWTRIKMWLWFSLKTQNYKTWLLALSNLEFIWLYTGTILLYFNIYFMWLAIALFWSPVEFVYTGLAACQFETQLMVSLFFSFVQFAWTWYAFVLVTYACVLHEFRHCLNFNLIYMNVAFGCRFLGLVQCTQNDLFYFNSKRCEISFIPIYFHFGRSFVLLS